MMRSINVWDPLVRVFHWSLVLFFFTAYLVEDDFMQLHSQTGYAVVFLLVFRLLWGFIGTPHARFSDFVRSPTQVIDYLRSLRHGQARHYLGHNPAGGWMVLALLASLLLTTMTGMLAFGGEGYGPLAGSVLAQQWGEGAEELHEFFANFTLLLVVIHVVGVKVSGRMHGENLVKAMITGRKERPDNTPEAP